jgi:hypothetical protein
MTASVAPRFLVVLVVAWSTTLIMRSVDLFIIWAPLSDSVYLMLIYLGLTSIVGYVLGIYYGKKSSRNRLVPTPRSVEKTTFLLSLLSLVGSLYLIFEFAVVRGYGFTTDVNVIRMLQMTGESQAGSALSGIGRLIAPAVTASISLFLLYRAHFRVSTSIVLGMSFLAHLYFEVVFTGGRFFVLISVLQYLFHARYFSRARTIRVGSLLFRTLLVAALLFFVGYVFVNRAGSSGRALVIAFEQGLNGHSAQMSDFLYVSLDTQVGVPLFAVSYIWLYLTQGLNQFYVLLTTDGQVLGYGFYQFPQLAQIASRLTGIDLSYDVFRNLQNPGTYNTFLGAVYIDFGYVGLFLQTPIFFFMTAAAIQQLHNGHVTPLSLSATLLMAAAILSPCVNVLTNIWLGIFWLFVAVPLFARKERFV